MQALHHVKDNIHLPKVLKCYAKGTVREVELILLQLLLANLIHEDQHPFATVHDLEIDQPLPSANGGQILRQVVDIQVVVLKEV